MKTPVKDLRPGTVLRNGHTVTSVTPLSDAVVLVKTRDMLGASHEQREHVSTKYEVESTDITPAWSAILPILTGVLQNPDAPAEAHKQAMGELARMAQLADHYVSIVQTSVGDDAAVVMSPRLGDPDQKEN